ncbi:hypothetical protein CHELA40_14916 [Chelatococcus asaccharovorans]|nr:hypothetical protein CHELA17_60705 [Chelatococcus asaccharovorans]CAH1680743.1 hypothetical protein CHELA40_14916 [Chelatococcus asaccharovorans]
MRLFSGRVFMDPGLIAAHRPGMTVGFHPNTACSGKLLALVELLTLTFDLEPDVRRDAHVKFAPLASPWRASLHDRTHVSARNRPARGRSMGAGAQGRRHCLDIIGQCPDHAVGIATSRERCRAGQFATLFIGLSAHLGEKDHGEVRPPFLHGPAAEHPHGATRNNLQHGQSAGNLIIGQ